jgi:hypothetical protein
MLISGLLLFGLICFRSGNRAASADDTSQPFASSIEQRQQTVEELRKLNSLMQKQIDLLTSGRVRVVVVEPSEEEKPERGKRGK